MVEREKIEIGPQPGPQTTFLETPADIAIYGGAAGGGKTFALLLDPVRHFENKLFRGVIFRKTTTQARNPGGLWDSSQQIYPQLQCQPKETTLEWLGPFGWKMKFAHLEYEKDVFGWQGAQLAWIGFDELTHFSEAQFFYMLSRLRSMSGIPGSVRATCNPDPDSWVKRFIRWWLDKDGEYADPAKAGKIRYFVRIGDHMHWADSKEELVGRFGSACYPKSVTFIPSKLSDNKILMKNDPSYLANLNAQSRVERARLLDGNWKIKAAAGLYFKQEYFPVVDAIPGEKLRSIRFWDRAATEPNEKNQDPDWSVGLKLTELKDGRFVIENVVRFRESPHKRDQRIKNTASGDGVRVEIGLEQEPGASGKTEVQYLIAKLSGYNAKAYSASGDKVSRASPASAQAEAGNILVLRGPWNQEFFDECTNFPDGGHDDQVDALSGGFNVLVTELARGEFTKQHIQKDNATIIKHKAGGDSW